MVHVSIHLKRTGLPTCARILQSAWKQDLGSPAPMRWMQWIRSVILYDQLIISAFDILSYHIISYHIISVYHILSYHIISYHIISAYHILSYHIISYHIISYHIISYHICLSYFVRSDQIMIFYHIVLYLTMIHGVSGTTDFTDIMFSTVCLEGELAGAEEKSHRCRWKSHRG